jgi:dihydropteroate synthase
VSRRPFELPLANGHVLRLGEHTLVMGILNVTPDSFADGGIHLDPQRAVAAGLSMVEAGADIIDVGGESTRPGAAVVPAGEERRRILPVIAALARQARVPISVDTYKAEVAGAALDAGASIVNDISGLRYEPDLARVVAERRAALVLMHTRGRSSEMYAQAGYGDVVREVADELAASLDEAVHAGVDRASIVIDPGIGFAKRAPESLRLLACLDHPALTALDRPILAGPSRKSFLQAALGDCPPAGREWGTAASVTAAVLHGAHVVRVHGVREMVQVVRVADAILAARTSASEPPPDR